MKGNKMTKQFKVASVMALLTATLWYFCSVFAWVPSFYANTLAFVLGLGAFISTAITLAVIIGGKELND